MQYIYFMSHVSHVILLSCLLVCQYVCHITKKIVSL